MIYLTTKVPILIYSAPYMSYTAKSIALQLCFSPLKRHTVQRQSFG